MVKNCLLMHGMWVQSLGWEDLLEKGYTLQYCGLENSMDCRVHGVTKSRTRLSNLHFNLYSRPLLVIKFLYGSVYLLMANSHLIPPSLSPWISISLISVSVGLSMFCEC